MINKQGAMFGLDARIALAIFGALSVISGAALYSAIQQSKVVAIVTEMKEIGKAIEQYNLDTGQDITLDTNWATTLAYEELMTDNTSGWKGPYLSFDDHISARTHFTHPLYNRIAIDLKVNPSEGFSACGDAANKGKACYYWVFYGAVDESLRKAVKIYIDGSESVTDGTIHDPTTGGLYMKTSLALKQYK